MASYVAVNILARVAGWLGGTDSDNRASLSSNWTGTGKLELSLSKVLVP